MPRSMLARSVLLFACVSGVDCGGGKEGTAPTTNGSAMAITAAATVASKGFYGRIQPRMATMVHAPRNFFRFRGWTSSGSRINLVELADDGVKVEKGDPIARFEFRAEEALPWIRTEIAKADAEVQRSSARAVEERQRLRAAAEVIALTAERSALDAQKQGLVSDRELSLLRLSSERARAEEAAAIGIRDESQARSDAQVSFLTQKATEWSRGEGRYRMYEKRMRVVAPHAGWIRYAYLNHHRRKVQKSDGMPSGVPFVYLAQNEMLSVEFLVPEQHLSAIVVGRTVMVNLPDGEEEANALVRTVAPYPQEVGFLRGDDELPDAHEKVYAVTADFETVPPGFTSGMEVRVKP